MNTNLTDMILNQAPEVYEQMVRWEYNMSVMNLCVFATMILAVVIASAWVNHKFKDEYEWPTGFIWLFACLFSVCLMFGVGSSVTTMVQIKTAPKAWLVEHIITRTK